jgi:hypothetical protein
LTAPWKAAIDAGYRQAVAAIFQYQGFTARGKPPKVAIAAIIGKLAILANAFIRDNREWAPKMA